MRSSDGKAPLCGEKKHGYCSDEEEEGGGGGGEGGLGAEDDLTWDGGV